MYKFSPPEVIFFLKRVMVFSFFYLLLSAFSFQNSIKSSQKIQLLFAGDIMGHGPQIRSAEVIKNQQYNYYPCFDYIKPIINQADLAVANLELSLPGKPPYQGYPIFRSPDDLVPALRDAGFDLLLTANNHCNDARKSGIEHAIFTLRENGFYQTGTFLNQEERELFYPLILYKKGFKLAFLNYTFGTNKIPPVYPTIINQIELNEIRQDMLEAQALQPDAIIVMMHWGKEYRLEESLEQRQLVQQLTQWGADLIVGAHPHVVQPIKVYEQGVKKTLVAYSLGNFISNQLRTNTDGGIMLEVELEKNSTTSGVMLSKWSYIPVWRQRGSVDKPFRVLPVVSFEDGSALLNSDELKQLRRFAAKTRNHLNRFNCSEKTNLKQSFE